MVDCTTRYSIKEDKRARRDIQHCYGQVSYRHLKVPLSFSCGVTKRTTIIYYFSVYYAFHTGSFFPSMKTDFSSFFFARKRSLPSSYQRDCFSHAVTLSYSPRETSLVWIIERQTSMHAVKMLCVIIGQRDDVVVGI